MKGTVDSRGPRIRIKCSSHNTSHTNPSLAPSFVSSYLSLLARQPSLQSFIRSSKACAYSHIMFAKLALPLIALSSLATGVFSSPVSVQKDTSVARRNHGSHTSFNKWQGIPSLDNFDNFYGSDNFNGYTRSQTVVESQEVCHSTDIVIIQQRLAVLQEMAKRIITEQICEVETQVITFEQYYQSLGHFRGDLRRHSGHKVGHDKNIVSHFGKIYNSDGSFCTDDWSFSGHDIGSQTVVIKDNWDEEKSHSSVDSAYYSARNAYYVNRFN